MPGELSFRYCVMRMKGIGLFFFLAFVLFNCFFEASAQIHEKYNVLVLNSYHKGMTWTDNVTAGIESALRGADRDVDIQYEYMDTKKVYDKRHLEILYELFRHKYRKHELDVVISCDDYAFKFLLDYRRNLFPDTPVVFCGVNFLAGYSLVGHDLITGVEEATDMKGTIDVALKLHPETKQIFVIVDKSATGISNKKALQKVIPYFKDKVAFSFLEDFDMPELLKRVQDLPGDSISLLLNYTSDKSGNTFSPAESVALISRHCNVPVYYLWDSDLGYGTVGGKLISGYAQGETAGEMALRILQGENANNIPIVHESPNRYMFDYEQLKRFDIDFSLLPDGSIVINKPVSFYSQNAGFIWSVIGITVGLSVIILLLSVNILQRRQAEAKLRETYDIISRSPVVAFLWKNAEGWPVEFVSDNVATLFGYTEEEFTSGAVPYSETVHPDDLERVAREVADYSKDEGRLAFDHEPYRIVTKEGKIKWVNDSTFIRRSEEGEITYYQGILFDITEQKEMGAALRESETRYRELVEKSQDLIYTTDRKGILTYVNPVLERILGYEKGELIGQSFTKIAAPEFVDVARDIFRKAMQGEGRSIYEGNLIRKDGAELSVEFNVTTLFNSEGRPSGRYGIGRDITERKKAEKERREYELRLASIINFLPDATMAIDREGRIIAWNRAIEEMAGVKADEIMGKGDYEYALPFYGERRPILIDLVLSRDREIEKQYSFIKEEGDTLYTEAPVAIVGGENRILWGKASPLYDIDGNIVGAIESIRDVTDRKQAEEELRREKELSEKLIQTAQVIVLLLDTTGHIVSINPYMEQISGFSLEEVRGKEWFSTFLPEPTRDQTRNLFLKAVNDDIQTHGNIDSIVTKDGRELQIEWYDKTLEDESGNVKGLLCIGQDVTERKQAEEVLRQSEEKYRDIFEKTVEGIYRTTSAGVFVNINPSFARICGYASPEEMMEKVVDIADQLYANPEDRLRFQKLIAAEGEVNNFDVQFKHPTKRLIWVSVNSKALRDEQGNIQYYDGTIEDITERKKAEEQIREYSENLERMVEERTGELKQALSDSREARDQIDGILKSIADGLIVTDLHNRVILMNRAAEDLLGVRLSEVIDRSIDYAINDETLRERIRATLVKRESGYQFDFELPGDGSDQPRIMRARTSVIEDKAGRHTGIITIINDVTYERELDRMKTDFITMAAHELRTPLTSIGGFSELLMSRDDITGEERARFLSHINQQSRNLAVIISDLLDVSRIESGKGFELRKVSSDIQEIVKGVASYFEAVSSMHEFVMDFPAEPTELVIDPDKIEQAVNNIFSNAVKYSPRGGVIRVTGIVSDDYYQVSVEDEGIGMTPDQVEKIFDKFYRGDSSHSAVSGTGLGMSIVKHFVKAHGGDVWVESEPGRGTTVRFTIPL